MRYVFAEDLQEKAEEIVREKLSCVDDMCEAIDEFKEQIKKKIKNLDE